MLWNIWYVCHIDLRTSSLFSTTHHLDRIITADYLSSTTSRAGLNVLIQKDYFKLKKQYVNMCIHIRTFTWASVLSICRCPQLYILLHSFLIYFLSRLERLGFWLRSNFSLKTNLRNKLYIEAPLENISFMAMVIINFVMRLCSFFLTQVHNFTFIFTSFYLYSKRQGTPDIVMF